MQEECYLKVGFSNGMSFHVYGDKLWELEHFIKKFGNPTSIDYQAYGGEIEGEEKFRHISTLLKPSPS